MAAWCCSAWASASACRFAAGDGRQPLPAQARSLDEPGRGRVRLPFPRHLPDTPTASAARRGAVDRPWRRVAAGPGLRRAAHGARPGAARGLFGAAGCIFGLWGAAMLLGAAAGTGARCPLRGFGGGPAVARAFLRVSQPAGCGPSVGCGQGRDNGCCSTTTLTGACPAGSWRNRCSPSPMCSLALQGACLLRLDVTADNAASRELPPLPGTRPAEPDLDRPGRRGAPRAG